MSEKITITISINVAAADKYEGNKEKSFTINDEDLVSFVDGFTANQIKTLLTSAALDYIDNN